MANPEDIERELERFVSGDDVRERLDALRMLFTWNVPQARELDPRMERGEAFLLERAAHGDQRLEAAAALGRILRAVKARSGSLSQALADALAEPLPSLVGWADAEERLFVARVLERVRPPWTAPYIAQFLIRDDTSAKAREVLSSLLVEMTGSIGAALTVLLDAGNISDLRDYDFERRARLLRLTLGSLRSTMSLSVEVGSDAAARLGDLVDLFAPRVDATQDRKTRIETARETLGFLALILRGGLGASFQPESYRPLRSVRAWFAPARWPDELRHEIDATVGRLSEAIEALCMRGAPDDGLFRALEDIVGRQAALDVTRAILAKRPGMPESAHSWLQSGPGFQRAATSESAAEASLRKADPAIASSMAAVRALQAEAAETLQGASVNGASSARLTRLLHETIQSVRMIAAVRGLKWFGAEGEVVDFDPLIHRMTTSVSRAAKVRIVQPAVIRQVGESPPVVIQLATVEPLPEGE